MFTILAVFLLILLLCLGLLIVVAATYVQAADAPQRTLDRGWALLAALAMVWAVANVYWSGLAGRRSDGHAGGDDASKQNATELSPRWAMLLHFAFAIGCGLIALGIHSVSFARAFGTEPVVMDYSHPRDSSGQDGPVEPQLAAGDAEEGRKVFSTTCITCHGPTGDGLPNLAPSLRGSLFIASVDDVAIAGVIRMGRAATDPANKTNKMMPARGGNPFLGDDKIAHLVAFVRAIQSEAPGAAAADPNAPPPVQLAKWVVPPARMPPTGLVSLENCADIGDDDSLALRDQSRKSGLVKALTLSLTGIHGLFLVAVMVASSHVLLRGLNEERADDESWWTWSTLGWIVAALVWLVVFLFGFVML